jgi:hypothetical protein
MPESIDTDIAAEYPDWCPDEDRVTTWSVRKGETAVTPGRIRVNCNTCPNVVIKIYEATPEWIRERVGFYQ